MPTKTPRKREYGTEDIAIEQKPPITLPVHEELDREPEVIVSPGEALEKDYLEALRFNEDPVLIVIHGSGDRNAAPVSDYCAVEGVPAEMLLNGRWVRTSGYLPRNVKLTLKRKYVEVLARSKQDQVSTRVVFHEGEDPENIVERNTIPNCPVQILHDPSPKGPEWFARIVRTNY